MQRPARSARSARPMWARGPALVILAAAVVVAAVAIIVIVNGRSSPTPPAGVTERQVRIPIGGGAQLLADVVTPKGSGRAPLVVFPTSWGDSDTEYRGLAYVMAKDGFQIVSYAQAGFGGSGGQIDYAGPPTQRDASLVIDWALAHTRADPKRIGMAGMSYGGGVSLLAAAHDPRIKAVVAMSTWTDLAACFYANDTTSVYSFGALMGSAEKTGNLDSDLTQITSMLGSNPVGAGQRIAQLSPARSASTVIKQLNANHPAIMIANGFEDSIIAPLQLVGFYDALTGPKRLQLAPGDHGGPEYPGILGAPNVTTGAGVEWLAHYLNGTANGIDRQPPVELQDVVTKGWHSYPSWPAANTTVQLTAPNGTADGFGTGAAQTWSSQIQAGTDTVATSGPSRIFSGVSYAPPSIQLSDVDRAHAFVWLGPAVSAAATLSGTAHLRVDARSSTGSATLFTYLYDVSGTGKAALMSVTPYTMSGAGALSYDLQPTSWTFRPGHRLAVVIDTVDPRWHSVSAPGSTVTLSSSAADPATLSFPLAS